MTSTVLILGASGRLGRHAASAFSAKGWHVKRYRRGTDMTQAARGASVIVNGLNPPDYHDWDRLIPKITATVIAAARATDATVIQPGNVYNYDLASAVIDESTPQRPISRKGRIRVEMEAALRASAIRTIVLRAGNFIDPDGNGDLLERVIFKDLAKGRMTTMGPPHVRTAWTFLPDWAEAAVRLATMRDSLARFEDIPHPGQTASTDDMARVVAQATGRSPRIVGFPWWALRLSAPVWELAREMNEMRYLYATPHSLSGERLSRLLPDATITPLEQALFPAIERHVGPDKAMRPGAKRVLAQ